MTNRGVAGQDIFLTDADRRVFLRLVSDEINRRRWACHAFCLMGNHYHLLLQAPAGDIAAGVGVINGRYAAMFYRTYDRYGPVFQGRFRASVVQEESHVLELVRYIALNPVRAGLVARPERWAWSSYSWLSRGNWLFQNLRSEWFVEGFGGVERLRRFVEAGM